VNRARPILPRLLGRLLAFALPLLAAAPSAFAQPAGPGGAGGTGDGPPIDLTCVGLMAPAAVHVRCAVPRDAGGEPSGSPLDFRYEWDFGDPAGKFNALPGWNAAHVYDRPGQYTITLTTRGQDGKETRRTTFVRIAPDDRKRVYVAADGSDAADGAGPGRAVQSVGRAFQLAKDDAWVLFRKGDVFDVSAPVTLYSHGLRVGNYSRTGKGGSAVGGAAAAAADDWSKGVPVPLPRGATARPPAAAPPAAADEPLPVLRKVQAPAKADAIFTIQPKAVDTLVEGIEFDSIWDLKSEFGLKKVPARAFSVAGTNFAVRWCSFRNLTDAVNTEAKPTGVMILENKFGNEIRGYGVYASGTDHAYVGNVMVNSRQEHLIRASEPGVSRVLIAYNDLSRPSKLKGCVELRVASWFTVANNYINGGTMRVGPNEQDKTQYPAWREFKCEWGVVQDNRLEDLFFNVRLGSYHVTFRNNVIRQDPKPGPAKPEDGDWTMIVECIKPGYDDVRKVVDLRIEHNTVINHSGRGYFLYLRGKPMGLLVRNNVYVADGGSAAGLFFSDGEMEGVTVKDNVFPPGKAGTHSVGGAPVDRQAWLKNPKASGDRYGAVPVDADDNVPVETGAGAKLGNDRSPRQAARAKAAGGTPP
jgi:hypothetical protein